jgi:gliding motility-associated-like protein
MYPGTYTITAKDLNNGCLSDATYEIKDGFIFPQLQSTDVSAVLDCGKDATITLVVTSATTDVLSYTWTPVSGAETSTLNGKPFLITNLPGTYPVLIENLTSGCVINAEGDVTTNNNMTASFSTSVQKGTAPLVVNLTNNSSTGAGDTSKIASVFNFGNGSSSTFSYNTKSSVTYTAPGTYTITLYSNKGSCLSSTQKIIVVDAASSYTVPNIFTPNNDGINDLFFIRSSNMKSFKIVIFDRTGNIVYQNKEDVGTSKEITWDGTTESGSAVPSGLYFYVLQAIKADGTTDKDIKGTLTLTR